MGTYDTKGGTPRSPDEDYKEKHSIFVYGSLRQGLHNFRIIEKNPNSKFLGYGILTGYRMMSLGSYPAIFPTNFSPNEIYGEIWEVDEDVFKSIDRMEIGAGYRSKTDTVKMIRGIDTVEILATFYYQDIGMMRQYYQDVEDGDWVRFLILGKVN